MAQNLTDVPLSNLQLDEGARPRAPEIAQGLPAISQAGRHLAAIHRHHLQEMAKARKVLRYIREGTAEPRAFFETLKAMNLNENMRVFGTLCGQECRMLDFHHNAEEFHLFPELEGKKIAGLSAVVAKLRAEHKIVHELLRRLTLAADKLAADATPDNLESCALIFDKLEATIRSHFSYEETELKDALDHLIEQL